MLRNRGAALALAALCALAGYGAWVSPQQPPYHQTAGNRAENRRYEIRSQAPDERIAFYTEVLAWFTGVLAVVSAVVQGFWLPRGGSTSRGISLVANGWSRRQRRSSTMIGFGFTAGHARSEASSDTERRAVAQLGRAPNPNDSRTSACEP
jgi:hypothetical protein